jgi:phosphohistidine phosphatase
VIVYFLRHGIAHRAARGQPDQDRALTDEGRTQLRQVASRYRMKPDAVITSPYRRAIESADAVLTELNLNPDRWQSSALMPDSTPQDLWNEIRICPAESILIVSHEPLLSTAISCFLGSNRQMIQMSPATLVTIEFKTKSPTPQGTLQWDRL